MVHRLRSLSSSTRWRLASALALSSTWACGTSQDDLVAPGTTEVGTGGAEEDSDGGGRDGTETGEVDSSESGTTGDETGQGPDETESPLSDDHAWTVRSHAVSIAVLDNDDLPPGAPTVEIVEAPGHGSAGVGSGGRVIYTPTWFFVGRDSFRYRVVVGTTVVGSATVEVETRDERWVWIADRPFVAALVDHSHLPEHPDDRVTMLSDIDETGRLVGAAGPLDSLSGLLGPAEGLATFDVPDAGATWLNHVGPDSTIAGAVRGLDGQVRGLLLSGEDEIELLTLPGAEETVLTGLDASGGAVGYARGATVFGDDARRAVRLDALGTWTALEIPETSGDAEALGIDASGEVIVGVHSTTLGRRAFRQVFDVFESLHPEGAAWSEASDVNELGTVVGSFAEHGGPSRGFVRDEAGLHEVDLVTVFELRLQGIADHDALVGTVLDPEGYTRGVSLMSVAPERLAHGTSIARYPEPYNPKLGHACGHATGGPFGAATATTDPASAQSIHQSHTSYTFTLVEHGGGHGGFIAYETGLPGRLTLFMREQVALRLRTPEGERIEADRIERTDRCADGIRWFYQFLLPTTGRFVIELGPVDHEQVSMILERSWVDQ